MIFSLSIANFFGQNFYYKIGASQATVCPSFPQGGKYGGYNGKGWIGKCCLQTT